MKELKQRSQRSRKDLVRGGAQVVRRIVILCSSIDIELLLVGQMGLDILWCFTHTNSPTHHVECTPLVLNCQSTLHSVRCKPNFLDKNPKPNEIFTKLRTRTKPSEFQNQTSSFSVFFRFVRFLFHPQP